MTEKEILIRHGEPNNKLDIADYGTEIQLIGKDSYTIYRQTSQDGDNPNWELIGTYPIDNEE